MRGQTKRKSKVRWLNEINADLKEVSVRVVDAQDRVKWKSSIRAPGPRNMRGEQYGM